jgi:nucleoside-diphosphate-sugar epimerase
MISGAQAHIVIGCGYLGLRVARLWRDAGRMTVAVTRSPTRAADFAREDLGVLVADVTRHESLLSLGWLEQFSKDVAGLDIAVESVLYAVGFDRTSGDDIELVYAGGLSNTLAALGQSARRAIYISTTGVYGPAGGEWVDEETPPDPRRDGGRASLAAEQILAAHPIGRHSAILRLAGIYGPGRVPHLDKLRAGEPLPVPRDGWLNLIHVDDAARIVVAADAWLASLDTATDISPHGPHIFCVSDGSPVRREEYYREAACILDAPPPRFVAPPTDSPAAARASANRRISNAKMRQTLAVELQYPSYREGLASVLATES